MSGDGRRAVRVVLGVLLVVAATAPVAAAPGGGDHATAAEAGGGAVTAGTESAVDAGPAVAQRGATIQQRIVVDKNPDPGSITMTFEYGLPSGVTDFVAEVPVVAADGVTVESMDGFERVGGGSFRWDGATADPSVRVRFAVEDSLSSGVRGIERGDWAFVVEPNTNVRWRGSDGASLSTSFEVDGEGYARSHMAFAGTHERRTVEAADERATFIIGREGTNVSDAVSFLRVANAHFDFGVHHDEVTVFVLPLSEREVDHVSGATIDTAFWVTQSGIQLDDTGTVFAHEYVHTRLGGVGNRGSTWLTEASAEYYGRVFALNAGVGADDYDAFLSGLRADRYAPDRNPVVLANPRTWSRTTADYSKGAHVLAALDAEIQRRTNGSKDLRDVFETHPEPFDGYAAFRETVIDVSGDESLGPWLDRYVAGDDLPPLPENATYYVADPSLDPDDDGLTIRAETDAGTNPFVADTDGDGVDDGSDVAPLDASRGTPTPTATATATPTATATAAPTQTMQDRESETGGGRGRESESGTEGSGSGFGFVAVVAAGLLAAATLGRRGRR
ncbi:MAG: hypothetical protein ABEJ82_08555 [Haloplanus sp.]